MIFGIQSSFYQKLTVLGAVSVANGTKQGSKAVEGVKVNTLQSRKGGQPGTPIDKGKPPALGRNDPVIIKDRLKTVKLCFAHVKQVVNRLGVRGVLKLISYRYHV
jgi:hypothetical protein